MGLVVYRACTRWPHLYLFLLYVILVNIRGVVPCDSGQQCCQLTRCFNLFEQSRESLGVQEVSVRRGRHQRLLTAEQKDLKCVTLRTYHHCMNEPRDQGCLSNLYFHSAQNGIELQMKQNNCTMSGTMFSPGVHDHALGPIKRPKHRQVCSYQGTAKGRYKQCGLFGDPHLRTFSDELMTCRIEGAWPLVSNQYLTVQVTSDSVGLHTATAITKLTVVIRRAENCADDHYVTYQAQTDWLPSTFDDGRTHFGPERSVRIREKTAGRHVEIYIRYIDTTLIIRQIGQYFTFALRMPEDIAEPTSNTPSTPSLQLCSQGCPNSERIDYRTFLAQKRSRLAPGQRSYYNMDIAMTRDSAEQRCRQAGVVDFYFDSCVFDLLTTGDANFTVAASVALADLVRLDRHAWAEQENRTSLHSLDVEYDSLSSGSCRTVQCASAWSSPLLAALLCFIHLAATNL